MEKKYVFSSLLFFLSISIFSCKESFNFESDTAPVNKTDNAVAAPCNCTSTHITNLIKNGKMTQSTDCSTITFKANTNLYNDGNVPSSGTTPASNVNSYNLYIPECITTVVINSGVTVTGRITSTSTGGTLTIKGLNRTTSKIIGENSSASTRDNFNRPELKGESNYEKYSAIYSSKRDIKVSNLTSNYPDKFHILGRAAVNCDNLDLITRPDDQSNPRPDPNWNTTDGIGGGANSSVTNCKINTYDDAIKVYNANMVISNVTIIQNRNGAPIQLGWAEGFKDASATISGLSVTRQTNASSTTFNQGVISWAGGSFTSTSKGTRTLTFTGTNSLPDVSDFITIRTQNAVLTVKGGYVCSNKTLFQKIVFGSGTGNTVKSLGCKNAQGVSNDFSKSN